MIAFQASTAVFMAAIHLIAAANPPGCCKPDVIFLVDRLHVTPDMYPGSVKPFLSTFTSFVPECSKLQASILEYASDVYVNFELDEMSFKDGNISRAELTEAFKSFSPTSIDLGSFSNLALALRTANDMLLKDEENSHRPDSPVTIVILAGRTAVNPQAVMAVAENLMANNVNIFVLGLGTSYNINIARAIASEPEFYFEYPDSVISNGFQISTLISLQTCRSKPPIFESRIGPPQALAATELPTTTATTTAKPRKPVYSMPTMVSNRNIFYRSPSEFRNPFLASQLSNISKPFSGFRNPYSVLNFNSKPSSFSYLSGNLLKWLPPVNGNMTKVTRPELPSMRPNNWISQNPIFSSMPYNKFMSVGWPGVSPDTSGDNFQSFLPKPAPVNRVTAFLPRPQSPPKPEMFSFDRYTTANPEVLKEFPYKPIAASTNPQNLMPSFSFPDLLKPIKLPFGPNKTLPLPAAIKEVNPSQLTNNSAFADIVNNNLQSNLSIDDSEAFEMLKPNPIPASVYNPVDSQYQLPSFWVRQTSEPSTTTTEKPKQTFFKPWFQSDFKRRQPSFNIPNIQNFRTPFTQPGSQSRSDATGDLRKSLNLFNPPSQWSFNPSGAGSDNGQQRAIQSFFRPSSYYSMMRVPAIGNLVNQRFGLPGMMRG